jgi:hypothetical protein
MGLARYQVHAQSRSKSFGSGCRLQQRACPALARRNLLTELDVQTNRISLTWLRRAALSRPSAEPKMIFPDCQLANGGEGHGSILPNRHVGQPPVSMPIILDIAIYPLAARRCAPPWDRQTTLRHFSPAKSRSTMTASLPSVP